MANRTVKDAQTIKGTNPQYLVEKIIRSRIYDCKYWKEECFALTCKLFYKINLICRRAGSVKKKKEKIHKGQYKTTDSM